MWYLNGCSNYPYNRWRTAHAGLFELVGELDRLPNIQKLLSPLMAYFGVRLQFSQVPGLSRLNVSLDSLDEGRFEKIARRSGLQQVLEGLEEQVSMVQSIRLNAVSIRGLTEKDIVPLATFCRGTLPEIY